MNFAYVTKCICKREVLKVRILDRWYTLCGNCYRDSLPDLGVMTDAQLAESMRIVSTLGEADEMIKRFIDSMRVERVCRRM